MQSYLEKKAIEERNNEIVKNDYDSENVYGKTHKDAISNGDVLGKGTNHGGHTYTLPDYSKGTHTIDYSNFDTTNGGGLYDIEGRNNIGGRKKMVSISLYNSEKQYGLNYINSEENLKQGQFKL